MRESDIMETIATAAIDLKIGGEWKHEVALYGCTSRHVNFAIDGVEYVIVLHEVQEGQDPHDFLREEADNA